MKEIYTSTILKWGGNKTLGYKWQWRLCTVKSDCTMDYSDPKTKEHKGNLLLENAQFNIVDESNNILEKLTKMKPPKPPVNVKEFTKIFYFSICPKGSHKTYYFAIDESDKDYWVELMVSSTKGPEQLKKVGERDSLPTLILHHDSPLSTTKVDFSNEVTYRQIEYEEEKKDGGETPPGSEQLSIKFNDSCSTKLNHERVNSDTHRNYYHNGSMSSGSSTISYRSSFSMTTSISSDLTPNESQTQETKVKEKSELSNNTQTQDNNENKQIKVESKIWKSCTPPNVEAKNFISFHRLPHKENKVNELENVEEPIPLKVSDMELTFGDLIENPELDNMFQTNPKVKEFCFD